MFQPSLLTIRLCLALAGCCLALVATSGEEVDMLRRVSWLRGVLALTDGRADAVADLAPMATAAPLDWQYQLPYGEALALAGQPARAKMVLRRAALLAPCRPEPWLALARQGRAQREVDVEIYGLGGLLRLFPDHPMALRRMAALYGQIGSSLLQQEMEARWQRTLPPLSLAAPLPEGVQMEQDALFARFTDNPQDTTALTALAAIAWQSGNVRETYDLVTRLHQLQPESAQTTCDYVHLSFLLDEIDAGMAALRSAPPEEESLQRSRALWSTGTGDYADAAATLARMHAPPSAFRRLLGTVQAINGDITAALPNLAAAWEIAPSVDTAQIYAMTLLAAEQAERSNAVLRTAMLQYPQETFLRLVFAVFLQQQGQFEAAALVTVSVAPQRLETAELLTLAALRYHAAQMQPRMAEIAERLLAENPGDLIALRGAMDIYRLLQQDWKRQQLLLRVLNNNQYVVRPGNADLYLELTALANGNPELATLMLEQARLVDGQDPALAWLLAAMYEQQGRWQEAANLYREFRERWPATPRVLERLALANARAGFAELARISYEEWCAQSRTAAPWLQLARYYSQHGAWADARACWQSAAQLPEGGLLARWELLKRDEEEGMRAGLVERIDALLLDLAAEQAATIARWTTQLSTYGVVASDEELTLLLSLNPHQLDAELLRERRRVFAAQ